MTIQLTRVGRSTAGSSMILLGFLLPWNPNEICVRMSDSLASKSLPAVSVLYLRQKVLPSTQFAFWSHLPNFHKCTCRSARCNGSSVLAGSSLSERKCTCLTSVSSKPHTCLIWTRVRVTRMVAVSDKSSRPFGICH